MTYENYQHFAEDMGKKLEEMKQREEERRRRAEQGEMAERKRRYQGQMDIFNFTIEEAKGLAQFGMLERCGKSLAEAKIARDGLYAACMAPDESRSARGLIIIPGTSQGLGINFAGLIGKEDEIKGTRATYELAVLECSRMLESARALTESAGVSA